MRQGALAVVTVAAAALVGCGGGAQVRSASAEPDAPGGVAASVIGRSTGPGSSVCADAAAAMPLPATFPRTVPLPPHAVPTAAEERSGGRLVLTAVAPGDFRDTLAYMQQAYPAAGLTLKEGEVEDLDAESNFTGNGLTGRWTLREIPGCHGDTLVTVLIART